MILGLAGYALTGKDTIGACLENYHRLAFADALKAEVTMMLASQGISVDLWGEDKIQWRDMLVLWGAKRRAKDSDYWIKQLYARHANLIRTDRVVITDVRYANEVNWILNKRGLVIRLQRPGYGPANDEEYKSFKAIDEIELPIVHNDGTPDQAARIIRKMIKTHNIHTNKLVSELEGPFTW